MRKEKVDIYYKDSIGMNGKGILYVIVDNENEEIDFFKWLESLMENISADIPTFYDEQVSMYIGNATVWTYDLMFDADPDVDLDKYYDWLDKNYNIKFIAVG